MKNSWRRTNGKSKKYVNGFSINSYDVYVISYSIYTRWSTVSSLMINSIIFMVEFIWFSIIRDTLLMFEQFLYVILLSGIVPGSIMLADWVVN